MKRTNSYIRIFVRFIVLISFSSFSQSIHLPDEEANPSAFDYDVLKKEKSVQKYADTDTLYIYIKDNKNINVFSYLDHKGHQIINYNFKLKDSSTVEFNYRKYEDFDTMASGKTSLVRKEHKNFIRKHKKEILTYSFFRKNREKAVDHILHMLLEILSTKRIIFMINDNETEGETITLRQVTLNRSSHKALYTKI